MNVVFGKLVNQFNEYFTPGTDMSEAEFKSQLNTQR